MDTNKSIISFNEAQIYQRDHLILKDVSFDIKKGEFVYLIGRTGSGKSSLLKILYGDIILRQGKAEIAGVDLINIKENKRTLIYMTYRNDSSLWIRLPSIFRFILPHYIMNPDDY